MFSRACARAGLPVAYTQGFNPRIRLSLPFPRPTGQSSDVERLLVDLARQVDLTELVDRLAGQTPVGVKVFRALAIDPPKPCHPTWVRYRIDIAPSDREVTIRLAKSLLSAGSIPITRVRHRDSSSRVVDIRPFIDAVDVIDDAVFVSVIISNSGSATAQDVCRALHLTDGPINHLVRRVEIKWDVNHKNQPVTP